ncbi:MAG: carboxypeptidase regulatory-like domain-containing protein, partial [Cyanobacteria bacterium SZAS LIN-3]|nr:carboxypeptidase regulatory-like domain-containing protein [Cyanobacteria bacterium SZAS LIN-3]
MSFADISSHNPIKRLLTPQSTVFSWELLVLQLLFLALVAVSMDKPTGSLSGQVALEEKGFDLATYNLRDHHVYAIVNGPRSGQSIERGSWVKADGTFEIGQLPVGEYLLRVRAPGFATETVESLFVQEGHINKLPHPVRLNLLNPTVNIAAESRVFTTKEPPHFWINASGAAKATVKVYKKDLFSVMVPDAAAKHGVNISNDFSMYVDSSKKFQNPFGDLSPVKSFTRDLTMDVEDNAHAEFKFDSAMEPGDYFAVAEVVDPFGKNSARTVTWFSVGDVGLVVKYSPTKTIVRAVDLNTLKGQPGVNVKLMNHTEAGAFD